MVLCYWRLHFRICSLSMPWLQPTHLLKPKTLNLLTPTRYLTPPPPHHSDFPWPWTFPISSHLTPTSDWSHCHVVQSTLWTCHHYMLLLMPKSKSCFLLSPPIKTFWLHVVSAPAWQSLALYSCGFRGRYSCIWTPPLIVTCCLHFYCLRTKLEIRTIWIICWEGRGEEGGLLPGADYARLSAKGLKGRIQQK